ncbi:PREDICTED: uncharacterized protein LOC104798379 [Tarenaya hassleriana]|uniref:uncharacterized protein LOC104798379 n=1 Tax=Tarenaya hassleriana TaxID=28532 RepID=UPI00053C4A2E|nr:PREDICTED: uncharacterized protein LOC104798379 [Tarenaya hassleriana]
MGSLSVFLLLCIFSETAVSERIWSREEMAALAGYGEEKLSSVVVTGSLLSSGSLPVPGAVVGVKCEAEGKRRTGWIKAVTDEHGEFEIELPSSLHAIPDLANACLVKPVHVPEPYKCFPSARGLTLVSSSHGFRVYTAGSITIREEQEAFV